MRVIRFRLNGGEFYGRLESDDTVSVGGTRLDQSADAIAVVNLDDVTMLPSVLPSKIVCVGLNYLDHATETGSETPSSPVLFAKFPSSIIAAGDSIQIPLEATDFVDYEAELGVIIGKTCRSVAVEDALEYVFGYTCVNDVSARDAQIADGQWVRGKSFDTFCPVGPWIVTADEIGDPQDLAISCTVNGATLQESSTREMIFGVAEVVSYISRTATLFPGDLIATGTPSGVGQARNPQVRLMEGDVVSVTIGSIGTLTNPVVSHSPGQSSR